VQQPFRAIPVTVAQSSAAAAAAPSTASKTLNATKSRQRLLGEGRALQRAAPAGQTAQAARATHATQTTAPSKPKKPPLVVKNVARQQPAGERAEVVVVGRPVLSSFLLSELKLASAALSPLASPRANRFKAT
jgi:hypothetical protein